MQRIGIRVLQQPARTVLRQVREGERLQVTERGQPDGLLVPASRKSLLDGLKAAGRLTKSEGDLLDLGAPLRRKRGVESPSARLRRMRETDALRQ